MIPTLLLVGLVAGGLLGRHRTEPLVVTGAVASLLWGVVVGVEARSAVTFVGGAALAAVNVAVGAAVGVGIHGLFRARLARDTTT